MKKLYGENICIIAPHPDDEVLGLGGSISKFSKNDVKVNLLVISGHLPPLYPQSSFETTKKDIEFQQRILRYLCYGIPFCAVWVVFLINFLFYIFTGKVG